MGFSVRNLPRAKKIFIFLNPKFADFSSETAIWWKGKPVGQKITSGFGDYSKLKKSTMSRQKKWQSGQNLKILPQSIPIYSSSWKYHRCRFRPVLSTWLLLSVLDSAG